jgi:hypothetical protein
MFRWRLNGLYGAFVDSSGLHLILSSQMTLLIFFKNFDHSYYSKYLFKNVKL